MNVGAIVGSPPINGDTEMATAELRVDIANQAQP
jgi:hypothetical protein